MDDARIPTISWVVLTRGDRSAELRAAIESISVQTSPADIVVVVNGRCAEPPSLPATTQIVQLDENIGVPGGRSVGVEATTGDVVGFLDDDAVLQGFDVTSGLRSAFASDPALGAVSFRIVDEAGNTTRRHVPRLGRYGTIRPGEVANFLGGACAIRRDAYVSAGGYWSELFYAHEELDLAWRLRDHGWTIEYRPDLRAYHPRTSISRHDAGWRLTGRNRVWIARRNLPWPLALLHVSSWLVIGLLRAPNRACRAAYASGWRNGWKGRVRREPISWSTVAQLSRIGRPPVI